MPSFVFITDANYALPTRTAIRSLIANCGLDQFTIYVIGVDLNETDISLFDLFADSKCKMITKSVSNEFDYLTATHPHVSKAALMKFSLADILIEEDKVLYLDSDILVLNELKSLFDINIDNYYGAPVLDMTAMVSLREHTSIGITQYFNSGVMFLNLNKWRKDNIKEVLIKKKIAEDKVRFMDQNAFNRTLWPNMLYLSLKYNYMHQNLSGYFTLTDIADFYGMKKEEVEKISEKPSILHLTSNQKPWNTPALDTYGLWARYTEPHDLLTVQKKLSEIVVKNYNYKKYLRYKILSKITWGKVKERYARKYQEMKKLRAFLL